MREATTTERVLDFVRERGIVRPRDLEAHGVSGRYLNLLFKKGLLSRNIRGLYQSTDVDLTENLTLAQVCKWVPKGVVCLLSALQYHQLTTQHPFEVWLAIDRAAHRPGDNGLPIRTVRFSGRALTEGVEVHDLAGVSIKVYSPAKTVADCFKYRNKLGLDIAIEALKECRRTNICSFDDLWHHAKICRVSNVIRPYMEALS